MNDYKFRGKRIDNGEWVVGCYAEFVNYLDGNTKPGIQVITQVPSSFDRMIPAFETELVEVIPATVGQFTGLKDKNGQELYDGDILQGGQDYEKIYGKPIVKIGEYIDNGLRHLDLCEDETFPLYGVYIETLWGPGGLSGDHELIKIGNIHDNPELLGGGPDDDI